MIWTIINVTFDINNPVDSKGHCVLESMVRDHLRKLYVIQRSLTYLMSVNALPFFVTFVRTSTSSADIPMVSTLLFV